MSVLHALTGILANSSAQISSSWLIFCGCLAFTRTLIQFFPQIFYVVEVWRLTRPLQNINTIILKPLLLLAVCLGSLSCWNVNLLSSGNVIALLRRFLDNMSWNFKAFIFPSMISISPTPLDAKDPHSITLQSPNFTVGVVLFGW